MVVLLKASVKIFQLSVFLRVLYAPLYVCYLIIKLMKFKKGHFELHAHPAHTQAASFPPRLVFQHHTHTPDSSPFKILAREVVSGGGLRACALRCSRERAAAVFHKGTLHYFDIAVLPWPERPPVLSISFNRLCRVIDKLHRPAFTRSYNFIDQIRVSKA